ncbi:MAG TPA: hypothetical protein PLU87_00140 [Sedimentisphaerales bacterium]|nr:hypothetical protein [Sedimentisphaerales bacterium]HRS09714.1 hypothetical protein [Sedimentisphaerales bacterium]HRV46395.1 hypothetical protein [Sedimentisphaerales bacterium]
MTKKTSKAKAKKTSGAKKSSKAKETWGANKLPMEEFFLLCQLRLAGQLHDGQELYKALVKWGRKRGLDMEKVLEAYNEWRVEIRKKYPNGILTGGWPEGF